jgi:hypothetical protein
VRLEGLESFGARVLEDLWHAIEQEHPTIGPEKVILPSDELALDAERGFHDAFIERSSRHFVGRQDLLARLRRYVESDDDSIAVVSGASGSGKSALLGTFACATRWCGCVAR